MGPSKRKAGSHRKTIRLRAERVRINRQGYDSRGKYWGVGTPLYLVYGASPEHSNLSTHVRAPSAKEAKLKGLPDIERELARDNEREAGYRVPYIR